MSDVRETRRTVGIVGGGQLEVVAERGRIRTFEELPHRSIALDGAVQGPWIDPERARFSFDHHDYCLRGVTTATCRQVFDALCLGLDPNGFTVFINDADADVMLALALLRDPRRVRSPLVRRTVDAVGDRDVHGPVYPVADPVLLQEFSRSVGAAPDLSVDLLQEIDCWQLAIDCFFRGEHQESTGNQLTPTAHHDWSVLAKGTGWSLLLGDGVPLARAYEMGHDRLVAVSGRNNGTRAYTVARRSDFVTGFPVGPPNDEGSILAALAAREKGWGGSSTIGGAPRHLDGSRSRLSPEEVFAVVEDVVVRHIERNCAGQSPLGEGDFR